MVVEIGAFVDIKSGQNALDAMIKDNKVITAFLESGRSNDLFKEKQFGDFGEAGLLTVIVEEKNADSLFDSLYNLLELRTKNIGVLYRFPSINRHTFI
jgi:hypothetical protein